MIGIGSIKVLSRKYHLAKRLGHYCCSISTNGCYIFVTFGKLLRIAISTDRSISTITCNYGPKSYSLTNKMLISLTIKKLKISVIIIIVMRVHALKIFLILNEYWESCSAIAHDIVRTQRKVRCGRNLFLGISARNRDTYL